MRISRLSINVIKLKNFTCPMMKVILQNSRMNSPSDWWPEKLFVISNFPLAFGKNSTRNKKLSVRLSESITLFSFLSHLSDLFGPFFILSSFFLFKSRSYQIFIFLPLTPQSHTLTKGRKNDQQREKKRIKIMIMTLHCSLSIAQKSCGGTTPHSFRHSEKMIRRKWR